jgi:NitT/TauT family transport system substrate-binding protein
MFLLSYLFFLSFAQSKMTLALNWKAEPQFGGFYAALLEEEYKKRGLQIDIKEGGSGTPTIQLLAQQKVDFAVVSADEILLNNQKGDGFVLALFATYQTSPVIIMSHKESQFSKLEDVFTHSGVLAAQSGLPYFSYLKKKFKNKGSRVKIVPYSGGVAMFANDKNFSQQGFLTSEPLLAEKMGLKPKVFLVADEGYNPYVTVLAVSLKFWQKSPEKVRQMVLAVRAGWQSYLNNPSKTNDYMAQLNKSLDKQIWQKSAEAQKPLIQTSNPSRIGFMSTARWQKLINQMTELKLLNKPLQAEAMYKNID